MNTVAVIDVTAYFAVLIRLKSKVLWSAQALSTHCRHYDNAWTEHDRSKWPRGLLTALSLFLSFVPCLSFSLSFSPSVRDMSV